MFAIQATLDVLDAPATSIPAATAGGSALDALSGFDDELAPARGLAHGLMLGLATLTLLGGALWWAL